MGRRGHGEGTIYKRPDERWCAQLSLEGGKRKTFYGKTRAEVARKLAEAMRDRDKGLPIVAERTTVAAYLADWLTVIVPTIGPTSLMRYEQNVRNHIVPKIGHVTLARLSPHQVQALYSAKLAAGLSPSTVRDIHKVLRRALGDGLRRGVIVRNVCELVDVPRRAHREMQVWTPEQGRAFLAFLHAQGHRLEAFYRLALATGMRQGELMALTWRDVDLERGIVQVRATVKKVHSHIFIAETKTPRSRRRIALNPSTIAALHAHKARQAEERLMAGADWQDRDLVFATPTGGILNINAFTHKQFAPLARKAGVPVIRFHDLRHTAATLQLLEGTHIKVVSEMLGHASVAITMDLYSHVTPDMQRDAAAAAERLFGGDPDGFAVRTAVQSASARRE